MAEIGPFLFFLILGASLISAELLIFSFSVFWFLFIGVGAIIAALVAWWVPGAGWALSSTVFVVASVITSVSLYAPLKRWQSQPSAMPGNDAYGKVVEVTEAITSDSAGKVDWSGASWAAKLHPESEALESGDKARIMEITGIVLMVKKV